jgi:hypothetical protein
MSSCPFSINLLDQELPDALDRGTTEQPARPGSSRPVNRWAATSANVALRPVPLSRTSCVVNTSRLPVIQPPSRNARNVAHSYFTGSKPLFLMTG